MNPVRSHSQEAETADAPKAHPTSNRVNPVKIKRRSAGSDYQFEKW